MKALFPHLLSVALCASTLLTGSAINGAEIQGFTEPYRDIDVPASEAGVIEVIEVVEGAQVTAGQELGRLNVDVLEASLEIADVSRKSIGKLRSAEAEARMYIERLEKLKLLLDRNYATQEELDRTAIDKEVAEARVQVAKEELSIRELEYARIQKQIEQRILHSPIDGIVNRVDKNKGEFVSPNDPVVMNVVQLNPLLAVFAVPSDAVKEMQVDAELPLVVGADSTQVKGTIEFVSQVIDPQSDTALVKVRIANDKGQFRGGEKCLLSVDTKSNPAPVAKRTAAAEYAPAPVISTTK